MNIQLRTPNHEEFLKIANFSFQNFVEETLKSSKEDPSVLRKKLGGPPTKIWENDVWHLIMIDEKQIGFVWVQLNKTDKLAFGYDIYLDPHYRSKGIGRQVMAKCGEQLKSLGIDHVEICVYEHNSIARNLYESLGFKLKSYDENRHQFTLNLSLN